MRVEELSIGDWVNVLNYHCDGRPYTGQVNGITKKHGTYYLQFGIALSAEIDTCEPIPITKDILERNGWEYNDEDEKFFPQTWVGGGLMLQDAGDCGYRIVVTSDYDDEDTNYTPFIILYVHELQHAMRLCGIIKNIEL